jgi:two-component system response regulator FlrC
VILEVQDTGIGMAQEPFAVVMTDLSMPGMDGREVARVVKHAAPETPVVLLTG